MHDSARIHDYKDLIVWKKASLLVRRVSQLTKRFPKEERFGIVSPMRRAAISIPSNISEGQARRTTGEFIQFLSNASGSSAELETQLIIAGDLGDCKDAEVSEISSMIVEIRKRLEALRKKLSTIH